MALGGGQGKLHYTMATKLFGGTTPYGTDVDLGEGLDKTYGAGRNTRKGAVMSRNRESTGAWLVQPPAPTPRVNGARYGAPRAPFGTELDVKRGSNVGFNGGIARSGNNIY